VELGEQKGEHGEEEQIRDHKGRALRGVKQR